MRVTSYWSQDKRAVSKGSEGLSFSVREPVSPNNGTISRNRDEFWCAASGLEVSWTQPRGFTSALPVAPLCNSKPRTLSLRPELAKFA